MPQLDRAWQPKPRRHATLVSQSRLIYNFAVGFRLTGNERYRDAARRGADALLQTFGGNEPGLWAWAAAEDGRILDHHRSAYGHAFAVFGLAHAFSITQDGRFLEAALATARALKTRFRDRHGPLVPALTPDGVDTGATRTQNPVMHLFEALLALGHEAGAVEAFAHARDIARWAMGTMMHENGVLPEFYSHDWHPLTEAEGGRIDIGHQFEWAYLLSRAIEVGALPAAVTPAPSASAASAAVTPAPSASAASAPVTPAPSASAASAPVTPAPSASAASAAVTPAPWVGGGKGEGGPTITRAATLIENALIMGFDDHDGGIWSPAMPDGTIIHRAKGWWEQCEAARALHRYATKHGYAAYMAPRDATLDLCRRAFVDPQHGGWFMRIEPDGTASSTDKGTEWKVDYHVVGLCVEVGG